ncbi:transglycosylase SLT domain-containing protein (plasmid) [Edwardsiella tarda]|uniref:transglycosylase SLT domain-containing protein n=1 Tax=Edwardsiella TaxID=635 RepID=UPI001F33E6D3|nr:MULTISPECIES: transglycosylase SLT domain-containing protein [Edwardsiella]UJT80813.1 transglycosylase SLT domain-containing protein [Edwardsiella piscicida]WKS82957.1 transglycosylase SLT domain-containing protein [Edwardsiella tarda]
MKKTVLLVSLAFISSYSLANDCFDLAGRDYRIDPDLLRAIAWKESRFNPRAIGRSPDKSIDIGLMQINSQHADTFRPLGISMQQLHTDPCLNIYTGAYVLAKAFKKWGVNWNAVGAYNAGFKQTREQAEKRYHYAKDIHTYYLAIKNSKNHLAKSDR